MRRPGRAAVALFLVLVGLLGANAGSVCAEEPFMPGGPGSVPAAVPAPKPAVQPAPVATPSGVPAVPPPALAPAGPAEGRLFAPPPAQAGDAPLPAPVCKATSAILVDAVTGTVLWSKNAHLRRPIASTTKIMTATLALEMGQLDDYVTFSEHARYTPYANLNALPGERFRLRELLYAMLLRSSNDACVAVAEHISGAAWKYAFEMTRKAHELGARDTNFVTVNGLYDAKHYSTAYDLALMTRYAIRNPLFNEVVGTETKTLQRSLNYKDVLLKNHNKFLSRYQGADGIKTGYVRQSGKCLVASATREEGGMPWRLITVVLNSGDPYGDSSRMMDWGRHFFQPVVVAHRGDPISHAVVSRGKEGTVPVSAANDLVAIARRHSGKTMGTEVRLAAGIEAPVQEAQVAGQLFATLNGRTVGRVDLVTAGKVSRAWTASASPWSGWPVLLVGLVLVRGYARTIAKGARRRGRRVATRRGELDHGGEGFG